jgi:hypothetical protein
MLRDLTFALRDAPESRDGRSALVEQLCRRDARFLFHGDGRGIFERAKDNFRDIARENDLRLERVEAVLDRGGTFAEIYAIDCAGRTAQSNAGSRLD